MKKIIIILLILSIISIIYVSKHEDYIIIPQNAIRFRIIPNSNSIEDIFIKEKVKDEITPIIKDIEKSENIDDSRKAINDNINLINNKIEETFNKYNYKETYKVRYGINHFPEKIYNNIKYNEGDYESLVIEIGKSSGDNYWCVLFPPLCMLESEESDEIEYKFIIKEIIKKFINK